MKKIFFLIAFIAAAGFYACDKIEGPTRENVSVDTSCHFDADNSVPFKKTLMMEFTGHLCGNCPEASLYLHDTIQPKYGDSLVIVSVHSGFFACTCEQGNSCSSCPGLAENDHYLTDFTNPTSDAWYDFYGIFNNPKGAVDGTVALSYQSWDGAIANRMVLPADVRIKIVNTYYDSDRRVRACVETKFLHNMTADYKLAVLLTEDSVIDYQEWYDHNPVHYGDYAHRHVLRASFNTPLGVPIASDTTTANSAITSGYNINIDQAWNADKCYVVAFVYNEATKEVIQVEEAKVK